jgi:chromosome segregation ATPase
MPRPTIDEEVVDRLTAAVDARTKVPAEHLGIAERIDFLLDELEDADGRAEYLSDRVDTLEAELDEARREREETGLDGVLDDPTGGTGGLGTNDRF